MGVLALVSYYNIGRVAVLALGAFFVLVMFAFAAGFWMYRKEKLFLPTAVLWVFYTLYFPIIKIGHYFGVEKDTIDKLCLDIRNRADLPGFRKTAYKDRILFLPQCLRAESCPAPLNKDGIQCRACGACSIGKIKKSAEKLGYRVFVVPGGSFVDRIVKRLKPMGIFGVACLKEMQLAGLRTHEKRLCLHGVQLTRAGCVNTEVDSERVIEELSLK
ncbi:MAG: DUF116 domain-containing protein [archaeon]